MHVEYLGCDAFYSTLLDYRSSWNWYVFFKNNFQQCKGKESKLYMIMIHI